MLSYVYNYLTDGFPPHSRKLNSVGITIPFLALNMCETTKPVYKHPWLVVVLYMWTMSRNHIPIFHTTITRHPKDWLLKSLQQLPCCLNPHSLPSFLPSGIMDRSLQLRHTSFWSWGLIDSKSRFRVWCTSQDGRVMAIPGHNKFWGNFREGKRDGRSRKKWCLSQNRVKSLVLLVKLVKPPLLMFKSHIFLVGPSAFMESTAGHDTNPRDKGQNSDSEF